MSLEIENIDLSKLSDNEFTKIIEQFEELNETQRVPSAKNKLFNTMSDKQKEKYNEILNKKFDKSIDSVIRVMEKGGYENL